MIKYFNKRLKNLDIWDISLIKWSVAAAVLFFVSAFPAIMQLVASTDPWIFFLAFIVFVARPMYRFYIK